MNQSAEEVILAEARRAISVQVASLDELRSRTGLLLAASSLSASFLGSAAASNGVDLGFFGGAAVLAFVVAIFSCLKVLLPKQDGWTFVNSPRVLAEDWIDGDCGGVDEMQRFIAIELEDNFDTNKQRIDKLCEWFRAAALAVGAEVILGSVQLAISR